jgi:hypothetical protein
MSSEIPPNPYFSGINYNPSFFSKITDYLTEAIANSKYLRLIGGILSGNLGIKKTPAVELDVNGKVNIDNSLITGMPENGTYGGVGTRLILYPGTPTSMAYSIGISGGRMWYATPSGTVYHDFFNGTTNIASFVSSSFEILTLKSPSNTNYQLLFAPPSATSAAAIQTIQQGTGYNQNLTLQATAGNVGIGTSTPQTKLHLHNTGNNQDVFFKLTDNATGTGIYDGITFEKNSGQDLFIRNGENARMYLFTNNQVRIAIQANGNVGIVDPATGAADGTANIFQVGNGGRLRISNGISDFTSIGSKETDDTNNTRIIISGHTRGSGNAGNIAYVATTATGAHVFYVGGNTIVADIDNAEASFYRNIGITGGNYFTNGELTSFSALTNTGGTLIQGYFIPLFERGNSFINIGISHPDSGTYSYWHGHIGTNNSGQPLYFNATVNNNMNINSFQQQSTNRWFIHIVPVGTYSTAVQVRFKMFA